MADILEDATDSTLALVHACVRFRIPYKLVSNNRKQFDSQELRKLYEDMIIKKEFAAVYHPQSNGQTEVVNKIIKCILKTKLEEHKGNWPEGLLKLLRSYNMTPRPTRQNLPLCLLMDMRL
ncbi:uncharacterized protein LOC141698606 [Apium graveolens]|uniref:uncharacterized protein LOC141698606 n=1 Tax=Apium graveolens TaxID=4045 RepID=UPI003D78E7C7